MSGDAVSANFIHYSWSYKFLKISKIMKTGARFHSETGLWTGTLTSKSVVRFPTLGAMCTKTPGSTASKHCRSCRATIQRLFYVSVFSVIFSKCRNCDFCCEMFLLLMQLIIWEFHACNFFKFLTGK